MDRWCEVFPNSNLWYSIRELYDASIMCVANRSTDDATVEVDFHGCVNCDVFVSSSGHDNAVQSSSHCGTPSHGKIRVVVPACRTRVAATVQAVDIQMPIRLKVQCSIIVAPEVAIGQVPLPDANDVTLSAAFVPRKSSSVEQLRNDEAEVQSRAVEHWLDRRKNRV